MPATRLLLLDLELVGTWARVILLLPGAFLAVQVSAKFCLVVCSSTDRVPQEFCELYLEQHV